MFGDKQDKKSQLFETHMSEISTADHLASVEVLKGTDRKGRTNVTFSPCMRFDKLDAYFRTTK